MHKQEIKTVLQSIAKEMIPDRRDLYPALAAQLSQPREHHGLGRARRWAVGLIFAGVLLLALVLTPAGQSFAQSILRFFTPLASKQILISQPDYPEWVQAPKPDLPAPAPTQAPAAEKTDAVPSGEVRDFDAECGGTTRPPYCSIAQIRALAPFAVKAFTELPNNFEFMDASGNSNWITLHYGNSVAGESLFLGVYAPGVQAGSQIFIGMDAQVESFQIGDAPAEYVAGGYGPASNGSDLEWDGNLDRQQIAWQDGQSTYHLDYVGSELSKTDLVSLIQTMDLSAKSEMPAKAEPAENQAWALSVSDLEKSLGRKLLLPNTLLDHLFFKGGQLNEDCPYAQVFYENKEMPTNGLIISQASTESDCLPPYIPGDGLKAKTEKRVVPSITETQVNGQSAQYVSGGWTYENNGDLTWQDDGWTRTLYFTKDGLALELVYWGDPGVIGMADLVRIAESMQ